MAERTDRYEASGTKCLAPSLGTFACRHPNGKKSGQTIYKAGKPDGETTEWDKGVQVTL